MPVARHGHGTGHLLDWREAARGAAAIRRIYRPVTPWATAEVHPGSPTRVAVRIARALEGIFKDLCIAERPLCNVLPRPQVVSAHSLGATGASVLGGVLPTRRRLPRSNHNFAAESSDELLRLDGPSDAIVRSKFRVWRRWYTLSGRHGILHRRGGGLRGGFLGVGGALAKARWRRNDTRRQHHFLPVRLPTRRQRLLEEPHVPRQETGLLPQLWGRRQLQGAERHITALE
mmetsp:Transcript_95256/g.269235  ORF Transcript_95256/g.269235 Transcript_95256/m.269235 type:complete len:231 (+) Transcript_95256:1023-1715(+)